MSVCLCVCYDSANALGCLQYICHCVTDNNADSNISIILRTRLSRNVRFERISLEPEITTCKLSAKLPDKCGNGQSGR